jgi:glycosyltransferase involved in cell wall biosynthesis
MNLLPLSVIMPVYNGEKYLEEAISNVLSQTFTDYELLIIDDGSSDSSVKIIQSIKDPRIRLIRNEKNQGVAYTRNVGLKEAKGEYLAWMDCDDLIEPNRLEVQINYLRENLEVGICGTALQRFGEGKPYISRKFLEPSLIKAALLFYNSLLSATTMYRMKMIREAKLTYNVKLAVAEDYDFFYDASFHFPIKNLDQVLYYYRASESSIMKVYTDRRQQLFDFHKMIYSKAFDKFDIPHLEKNFELHYSCASTELISSFSNLKEVYDWLIYLKNKNSKFKIYDENSFDKVLASVFFSVCKKSSSIGPQTFLFYLNKKKSFIADESFPESKLLLRCLIFYNKF